MLCGLRIWIASGIRRRTRIGLAGTHIMPKYRAILQVSDIAGDNPAAVRTALDEQLRKSGLENCRVVTVEPEGMRARPGPTPPPPAPPESAWRRQANAGGLLLVAAAAWALWFFWWMFSSGVE